MKPTNYRLAVYVAVFLGALGLFFAVHERAAPGGRPSPPSVAQAPARSVELPRPASAAKIVVPSPVPAPSAPAAAPAALDEMSLMAKLRELRGSNPELTLQLAREAQARFKSGPDAAEQSWFVVKSLTDLGRHDEARVEGRRLIKDYPGTRWAEDAHRHLFVNPGTHPAERGYGKDLDLE